MNLSDNDTSFNVFSLVYQMTFDRATRKKYMNNKELDF